MSTRAKRTLSRKAQGALQANPAVIESPTPIHVSAATPVDQASANGYSESAPGTPKEHHAVRKSHSKRPWTPPPLHKEPRVVRPREEGKWKCTECDMTFKKPSLLNSHLESHSDQRPYVCPWEGCTSAFKRPQHLDRHYRTHTKQYDFVCPWEGCGRGFVEKWLLDDHYRTHMRKKSYICDYEGCTKEFPTQSALKAHMTEHGVIRTYTCLHPDCDAMFPRMEALQKHVERIHTVRSYPCPKCPQVFSEKYELADHKKEAHAPEFPCEHCEKEFHTRGAWTRHQMTHETVRPTFPCNLCDKAFLSQTAMLTHQRVVHEGVREFVCDQEGCGREFAHKKTLVQHLRRDHSLNTALITYPVSPAQKKAKLNEADDASSTTVNARELGVEGQKAAASQAPNHENGSGSAEHEHLHSESQSETTAFNNEGEMISM